MGGFVSGHEVADFGLGFGPEAAAIAKLPDKMAIIHHHLTKCCGPHSIGGNEVLNVSNNFSHAKVYKCDKSHRQGVKEHLSSVKLAMCDRAHMAKAEFPIRNAQKAIRRLMEERGDKPKPLAFAEREPR